MPNSIITAKEQSQHLLAQQLYAEYSTAKSNQSSGTDEFEAIIDMLECKRTEKNYEWQADFFYPEYPAILNTEASQWAGQYFQSRDFVDVYLETDEPDGPMKCMAAKKLINRTLNRRALYHYQKYMRSRTINSIAGFSWKVLSWHQKLKKSIQGYRTIVTGYGVDEYGQPYADTTQEPVWGMDPVYDYLDYEVIDPRNVFTSNEYTYSAQQKRYIIIRSEDTYEGLILKKDSHGYVNLDKIKALINSPNDAGRETETSSESYNKEGQYQKSPETRIVDLDILERYGQMWAVVKSRDEWGNPEEIDYPFNAAGELKDNAEVIKGIMTMALYGSNKILIRYQPLFTIDSEGNPYYPIIRSLCYIHPTKDTGMSDGKYSKELQVAINDNMNMSSDRVKLATIPTFKGKRYAVEENNEIYIEPGHTIPLEDPTNDLQELDIKDDITGALNQHGMLVSALQKVNAVYPTTMGELPAASNTATSIAGADQRSNDRSNYKSLTVEYTDLTEFYWIILQMSYQFMHPKTALKLLGPELVSVFDPSCDYSYKPITSAIEQEHSKTRKIQAIDQAMGRVAAVPNPRTPIVMNKLLSMWFDLMGQEFNDVKDALFDESPQAQMMAAGGMGGGMGMDQGGANLMGTQPNSMTPNMPSNQNGVESSDQEMVVRGSAGINQITGGA